MISMGFLSSAAGNINDLVDMIDRPQLAAHLSDLQLFYLTHLLAMRCQFTSA